MNSCFVSRIMFKPMKTQTINTTIARLIRMAREHAGKTQDEVAQEVCTSRCNYSKIENGKRVITIEELFVIAETLNLNIVVIMIFVCAQHERETYHNFDSHASQFIYLVKHYNENYTTEDIEAFIMAIRKIFESLPDSRQKK